jgi:DNA-binding transcriptional regulator YiaG
MTPDEFRQALERLGLTQVGLSRLIGVEQRTARRWASGATPIPPSIAAMLRLIEHIGLTKVRALLE